VGSIFDQLDKDYAPAWRPEPGAKVVGTVTDLTARDGQFGRYAVVTIHAEGEGFDGEVAVHAFHEVLANELARVAPKVGDRIGIRYDGRDSDKGYHRYRVRGEDSRFDWGAFGDPQPGPADMFRSEVPGDTAGLGEPERSTESDDDEIPF
jgi:hypothetical protein